MTHFNLTFKGRQYWLKTNNSCGATGSQVFNGTKIRSQSVKLDLLWWRQWQVGHEESNFPISSYYRTNKLQSVTNMLTAPLAPLSHTSCDSPNHNPEAVREVSLHVSPGAGPLSQGNKHSQWINQTSFELAETWLTARFELSFSFCLLRAVFPSLFKEIVVA